MKQQQGEIMLSSLKGPRQFYLMTHGRKNIFTRSDRYAVRFFPALAAIIFLAAPIAGKRMRERAASSWRYTQVIWRLMRADNTRSPAA